jgi:hypothetical protein
VQISLVMLWTSDEFISRIPIPYLEERTQGIIGSASSNNARCGSGGNGTLLGNALARVIRGAATSTSDCVLQAREGARWQHSHLTGNSLGVGNRGQDEGCDNELHVCGFDETVIDERRWKSEEGLMYNKTFDMG